MLNMRLGSVNRERRSGNCAHTCLDWLSQGGQGGPGHEPGLGALVRVRRGSLCVSAYDHHAFHEDAEPGGGAGQLSLALAVCVRRSISPRART